MILIIVIAFTQVYGPNTSQVVFSSFVWKFAFVFFSALLENSECDLNMDILEELMYYSLSENHLCIVFKLIIR